MLDGIREDKSLNDAQKRKVETEAMASYFNTAGAKLAKRQKVEIDVATAAHKAATERTLVSPGRIASLKQMADFLGEQTDKVPGTEWKENLFSYTSRFSKGGDEPIRRRSESPEPPKTSKRRIADLLTTVESAKKRASQS